MLLGADAQLEAADHPVHVALGPVSLEGEARRGPHQVVHRERAAFADEIDLEPEKLREPLPSFEPRHVEPRPRPLHHEGEPRRPLLRWRSAHDASPRRLGSHRLMRPNTFPHASTPLRERPSHPPPSAWIKRSCRAGSDPAAASSRLRRAAKKDLYAASAPPAIAAPPSSRPAPTSSPASPTSSPASPTL
ncbi:Hypothetical protein CAP_3317 [Chondromyces apiculatus DSM 436]|uniref:Uncharacterized protein n=1 Tax=Chondromyces apiculatus DSM 436 TaxID=1192034 RepID=A0A017T9A7_9BACT|nr:Hypothetical protein CAP_3317 [Chondromyces apiculatus DSM 436]